MILPKHALYDSKKLGFNNNKKKTASWLLSRLGIKTHLSKIYLVGPYLF